MNVAVQLADKPVFWTKADGGRWLDLKEVRLPDWACQESPALAACLAAGGYAVVSAPPEVVAVVRELCPTAKIVTPSRIRSTLRAKGFQAVLNSGSTQQQMQVGPPASASLATSASSLGPAS